MTATAFARGDVLRSPSGAIVEVIERIHQGGQFVGYDVLAQGDGSGDGRDLRHFLAEHLAASYRRVVVDDQWREAPLSYGLLQERFVRHGRQIRRELRRIENAEAAS